MIQTSLSNQSPLPLDINGRGKRYGNRHSKEAIGLALEYMIGNNQSPADVAQVLNLPMPTICEWMTRYWFYHKIDNPIVLVLTSNV
jgi:hypothetical protein